MPSPMNVTPVTLEGRVVRMEPLDLSRHFESLCEIGLDPELWRWTVAENRDRGALRRYLETALREQAEGRSLPFATVLRSSGRAVGCTRFGNIDTENRKAEIGWTWVGAAHQRTGVNTEAKLLMLTHAFETWGCVRVELKTDALNARSRAAILRVGGKEEGTLRSHMVTESGRRRDTVYFSILDSEWPAVKTKLEGMMAAPGPS